MKRYGVIMAGGSGSRLWPISRRDLPKQFLKLDGKETMLNKTIDRLTGLIQKEDIFIVTGLSQKETLLKNSGDKILENHILAEPSARNTAACIGYAAMEIMKKYGDGIMGVFASDHYIGDNAAFAKTVEEGMRLAEEKDALVTIGIKPTFPSTEYGYILRKKPSSLEVEEFVEKPDLETARRYLDDGRYLWNSGMFIWKASVILEKYKELLPDIYACLKEIGDSMGTEREEETIMAIYPHIPKISVDYGIMERAKGVLALEGHFGWNDIGNLDAISSIYPKDNDGNVTIGETLIIDTKDCTAYEKNDRLLALIGLNNVIAVDAGNVVLVCAATAVHEVRKAVERLEKENKARFL